MGGEAIANGDNVADWEGAQRLINSADRDVRRPPRRGQQRRHPARPRARQHDRAGVGRRHQRPPEGHVRAVTVGRRLLARAGQGRRAGQRPDRQHDVGVGHLRQRRSGELRRGQGRHRRVHEHRRARGRPVRRDGQRRRPGGADPDDRRPRPGAGVRRGTRGPGAALDRTDRHVAVLGGGCRRDRAVCSRRRARRSPSPKAGSAGRRRHRSTTRPSSARSSPTCSPRPGRTRAWTARPVPGPRPP